MSISLPDCLSAPLKQIADNGGIDGSVVVDEIRQKSGNIGFDANTGEYVDMLKAGHHRSGQGGPHGAEQCGQHRRAAADDRGLGDHV